MKCGIYDLTENGSILFLDSAKAGCPSPDRKRHRPGPNEPLNSSGERSCIIANGFSGTSVLAACGREQKAYEDANGGVFTSHLIETLINDFHTLTYTSLVHKMNLKMPKEYVSIIFLCPSKKNLRLVSGKIPIVRDKKSIGGYLTNMSLTL